ncbi:DUF5060 domain-containing protein [Stieleria varia]|uniref:DUF5060 domain-containing protein n=1 Tax=Stieleria varia TaxID=2528005 RepID=A0A5C6AXG8_9BACT|nr:DUF5060 domain-containing protein [Stieleria varia]TWU04633.1 hypothetical protein Pla52n_26750 [Stieleria varia]
MTLRLFLALAVPCIALLKSVGLHAQAPITTSDLVFGDRGGVIAVEAEHFVRQEMTDTRAFYLTHQELTPEISPDGDPNHVAGASGGAYLEILPDTRRTHDDRLIKGTNFAPEPGKMAVVSYQVDVPAAGRYYVWVRAHSTGGEDNGLHVGLDGQWPESGQRLQWCEGKKTWRWESKQRTEAEHCGEPYKIFLDIDSPGRHVVSFSMREDGFEFDKWLMTTNRDFPRPTGLGPEPVVLAGTAPKAFKFVQALAATPSDSTDASQQASQSPLRQPRQADGEGTVTITGTLQQWHKITLTIDGPFAHEQDNAPNPFLDRRLTVTFRHSDGTQYNIPGFFAADGDAANSGAEAGTKWQARFAPDRTGKWTYKVNFVSGDDVAIKLDAAGTPIESCNGKSGEFQVTASNAPPMSLRAQGRLQYVGQRYLQHATSKRYFLKAGADAPETLLGYADFDNTVAGKPSKVPLKTWAPHLKDWRDGDPTWRNGKGKGLIGAVNYLADKGCNAFSFLTYNAGGDGDNVWPFVQRNDKLHYDCSKLDQWGVVFDHGTDRDMYLHFKMQETENDDNRSGKKNAGLVPESLDGGDLGTQRKLYCRELVARFGHNLALNWNLGEENTQTTKQQTAMIDYIAALDAYDHNIVIHTFPDQQAKVYEPLLGNKSKLTGVSLQNSGIHDTHHQTVHWVTQSIQAGKPWIVAFDESGTAAHGQCPDIGYEGYDGHDRAGKMTYTPDEVRRQTLWGTLMGGGAGVEYYFGYQYAQNDLVCEDWRSRDKSWDYCRIALDFFRQAELPLEKMLPADELIGNPDHDNTKYCLALPGECYLVYLATVSETTLDLSGSNAQYAVSVLNPRTGEVSEHPTTKSVTGGATVTLNNTDGSQNDCLLILRKR